MKFRCDSDKDNSKEKIVSIRQNQGWLVIPEKSDMAFSHTACLSAATTGNMLFHLVDFTARKSKYWYRGRSTHWRYSRAAISSRVCLSAAITSSAFCSSFPSLDNLARYAWDRACNSC